MATAMHVGSVFLLDLKSEAQRYLVTTCEFRTGFSNYRA
jgi:hypothetical protein